MSPARWGLAALAAGLGLRLWGLDFGLPNPLCRPDEAVLLNRALAVAGGDLNPHFFNYPSLHIYVLAVCLGLWGLVGWVGGLYAGPPDFLYKYLTDATAVFVTGRLVTVAMGVASIGLAYALGRRLGGRRAGPLAAGFLAVAPLHVRDSHFATVDVPVTCWILLAYYLCWRYLESGRSRDLWWSAAALGLAVSTKYSAALFAPALVAAPLLRPRRGGSAAELPWRDLGIAVACLAGAFLAGTPWAVLDPAAFWGGVAFEGGHFAAGHLTGSPAGAAAFEGSWLHHLRVSLWHGPGWPVAVAGWAAVVWLARRRRPEDLVLLSGAGLYLAVASAGSTQFLRYALPLIPLQCVMAGALLARLGQRRRPSWTVLAAVLGLAPAAWASWHGDRLLAAEDTRVAAARWVEEHVPAGQVVALTGSEYGHPRLRHSRAWLAERLADLRRAGAPARRLALQLEWHERQPHPGYYTVELRPPGPAPLGSVRDPGTVAELRAAGVTWLITSVHPLPYSRLGAPLAGELEGVEPRAAFEPAPSWSGARFDPIDAFYVPYAGFTGVTRPGPAIRIYRLADVSSQPPPPRSGRPRSG